MQVCRGRSHQSRNGVPSFAVSTDTREAKRRGVAEPFAVAAEFAAIVARKIVTEGLPPGVLLNVNVPGIARTDIAGAQVMRMCRRIYRDELVERADPRGKPYYWIGGEEPTAEPDGRAGRGHRLLGVGQWLHLRHAAAP